MNRDPAPALAEVSQRAAERGLPPLNLPEGWPDETWSLAPLRAALFADEHGRLREFSARRLSQAVRRGSRARGARQRARRRP